MIWRIVEKNACCSSQWIKGVRFMRGKESNSVFVELRLGRFNLRRGLMLKKRLGKKT